MPRKFTLQKSWVSQATIGFLGATNPTVWGTFFTAFDKRLRALGWIDGNNIAIEQRWAEGDPDNHAGLAKTFADLDVDIIVTSGTQAVLAPMQEAKRIPIVFASAGDPVRTKLVESLDRPGGYVTGLSNGQTNLAPKRLEELRQVIPNLKRLAILGNFGSSVIELEKQQIETWASSQKPAVELIMRDVRKPEQIGPAIKTLRGQADALYVCTDPFITTHRVAINIAAAAARLPTMHAFYEYVEAGGLMSYGPDFREMFERAADLVDRILRGTKPGDIRVEVQEKFQLVINESTANALDLDIPKGVRDRAKIIR
jgi:putative ABC transport system substrate-binding protein